ncbi:prepilin-type N-terminal cleavage/methylation domain-containing protein [Burkholderiales bacterium JOSHI_001]|nr:prepilin-type N-terminal cleavage/methylation domain-containing protein [Burkholderiales bacterium JOSHI_001]
MPMTRKPPRVQGFTLIELIVVMAIVALLASIAAPRYMRSVDVARENALRSTLATLRDAIDQYAADRGHYPQALEDLVRQRYLRQVPQDPFTTRNDSWVAVSAPPDSFVTGPLADVRSGAAGRAGDGSLYADW